MLREKFTFITFRFACKLLTRMKLKDLATQEVNSSRRHLEIKMDGQNGCKTKW